MTPVSNLHSVAHRFNPVSLKLAREYRGLTKSELAQKLNLSPSAISQFERGQIRPNVQTIAHLSIALGFPSEFFGRSMGEDLVSVDQCHFRSLKTCPLSERRKMVGAGNLIGMIVELLDAEVHLPHEQITPNVRYEAETNNEIEEAAARLREAWGLGQGPIDNLIHLLESKGVLVFHLQEDCKRLDAFSLWFQHRPFIFLNLEKGSASRSRFNAAHELGHLVLHPDFLPGDSTQEDEANKFASAFLMPRETFLLECPRRLVWGHFRELKLRWKVSLAALVRRARDLQVISQDTYRRAYFLINKYGWRLNEPDEPSLELPTILPGGLELLSRAGWTLSSIADRLSISERDLRWLAFTEGAAI